MAFAALQVFLFLSACAPKTSMESVQSSDSVQSLAVAISANCREGSSQPPIDDWVALAQATLDELDLNDALHMANGIVKFSSSSEARTVSIELVISPVEEPGFCKYEFSYEIPALQKFKQLAHYDRVSMTIYMVNGTSTVDSFNVLANHEMIASKTVGDWILSKEANALRSGGYYIVNRDKSIWNSVDTVATNQNSSIPSITISRGTPRAVESTSFEFIDLEFLTSSLRILN